MAEPKPPSSWRVVRLIAVLEARRWLNRGPFFRRKNGKRDGTQRKGAPAKLLLAFVTVALGFNVVTNASRIVRGVADAAQRASAPGDAFVSTEVLGWLDAMLERDPAVESAYESREAELEGVFAFAARNEIGEQTYSSRVVELRHIWQQRGRAGFHETRIEDALWPTVGLWYAGADPTLMLAPLALICLLLSMSVISLAVVGSDRDLARSDERLEWWFSFPVPTRALLLARILGSTLVQPLGWLLLAPFFCVVFWCAGHGPYVGALLGLAAGLYFTLLGACLRVLAETTLRRLLPPRRVSHVQAGLEVLAMIPLMGALATSSKAGLDYAIEVSRALPDGFVFNPLSLPVAWLMPQGALAALAVPMLLAVVVYATISIGSALLRDGLLSASEPVLGTRARRPVSQGAAQPFWRQIAARELLAMAREPARLARVTLVPMVTLGLTGLSDPRLFRGIISEPMYASAAAFGLGTMVLAGGGLVTLANEGPGLWMLYAAPWSLDAILARRAMLWSTLAGVVALVTLIALSVIAGDVRFVLNGYAALALFGVGLYGFVSVALGALGTDVMESARARRVQPLTAQVFLLLTSMFAFALYSPSAWGKFAQLSLSALFAFALWQKLRDHTPYFLDPTEAPPPAIAVSDGIFAALAFFVAQGLLGLLFMRLRFSPGLVMMFSFSGAGLLVSVAALWSLHRIGVPRLAHTVGLADLGRPFRTVSLGVLAGLLAGAGALLYTQSIERIPWLRALYEANERVDATPDQLRWLAVLAVIAAPLFEELIFRGILYRGLRRSLGTRTAIIASALVFAIVHPALSFAPVFVMALCAATVFELSGSLFAPILTHMIYNGIVLIITLRSWT